MKSKAALCAALAALSLAAFAPVAGAFENLDPAAAAKLASEGKLLLIDIREPDELAQTGSPKGAGFVRWNHPSGRLGFAEAVFLAAGKRFDAPVALICRTGNRSSSAADFLERAGFSKIVNVPEGVLGNGYGPGWKARGLPLDRKP